jgi:hypothetical protein
MLISLIVLELCPGQSSKCKNEQRAITPKLDKTELWFFCTALPVNEIYLPTKIHVNISYSLKLMSQTKFKWLECTKGNNSKKLERQSYGSSALHIYPMRSMYIQSFMLIPLVVSELCPGQEKRTDQQTDKAVTICHP